MNETKDKKRFDLPSAEKVQEELSKAESMDDFFGKDGIFAKLFANTMEQMLEAELSDHLGYDRYEAKGRNSGNNRNGHYYRKLRTSNGDVEIQVPRDRKGSFEPKILPRYGKNTNELEEKILGFYARGISTRDIQDSLHEMYGVDVSHGLISQVTDKIWDQVEEWQNRPLEAIYPIIFWTPCMSRCGEMERSPIRRFTLSWGLVWMARKIFWVTGWRMEKKAPTFGSQSCQISKIGALKISL